MRELMVIGIAGAMVGCLGSEQPCSARPSDPLCRTVDGGGDVGATDGGPDAGPVDAGRDASGSDAHVPCDGSCTGTTPHCLVTTSAETCVGCLASANCVAPTAVCDTAGDHACVGCVAEADCAAGGTHCETTSRACVACLDSTQCGTGAAARCDTTTHACTTCATSGDCAHLTGTPVCGAGGLCVQCTAADETACGANSCNPGASTCTSTPRASVATCRACVADSECTSTSDRCVPMEFMGASHGSYCLRQGSAVCARPYTVPTPARASTSGAAATASSGVDETQTTCEAVRALVDDSGCVTAVDCGATGLADGQCQTVNLVPLRCTYACGGASQCPSGFACGGAGYCGSP
jgi:hypothetical protein